MYTVLLVICIVGQSPEAATERARAAMRQHLQVTEMPTERTPPQHSQVTEASPPAPLPPAPVPVSSPTVPPDRTSMVEEMLAFIYIHHGPDQMEKSREMFDRQTDSQVRIIYRVFLDTKAKQEAMLQSQKQSQQTLAMGQAQLNLDRAKAYRDHLAREFQLRVIQSKQEQNLVHQHQHNLEAAMRFGFMNFPFPNYRPYPIYGMRPGIYYPRRYGW